MAESTQTTTVSDVSGDEFGLDIDWGDEPELAAPACDLSNPDYCESCM